MDIMALHTIERKNESVKLGFLELAGWACFKHFCDMRLIQFDSQVLCAAQFYIYTLQVVEHKKYQIDYQIDEGLLPCGREAKSGVKA